MRSNRLFVVLVLVISALTAAGQQATVAGLVRDAHSHAPLPLATVVVFRAGDTSAIALATTNRRGEYQLTIPAPGNYRLRVSYLGYEARTVDSLHLVDKAVLPATELRLLEGQMAGVSVTARKPYLVLAADKIILNVDQSPVAAGSSVYDVLRKAPGMMEQGEALAFRGRSITVWINGRPSQLQGEDLKNFLQNLQAATVEKVEIISNPSSRYAAEGGTVVNIVLAKDKSLGTNYALTATVGTGRKLLGNGGLDLTHRARKLYAWGGYTVAHQRQYFSSRSERGVPEGLLVGAEFDRRVRINQLYKAGFDYELSRRLTAGASYIGFTNRRNRVVENRSGLAETDTAERTATRGDASFQRAALNTYLKAQLDSAGRELVLNLDYLVYHKRWDDDFRIDPLLGNLPTGAPGFLRNSSPARIRAYAGAADFTQPTRKGRWELGVKTQHTETDNDVRWERSTDGRNWSVDAGKTNRFVYTETVHAAYANRMHQAGKWQWQAGLRVEQTQTLGHSTTIQQKNRRSYTDFFPNASTQYTPGPNHQFGLAYRKSITRFGFSYVNPFIIYQNRYQYSQGNPNILPELYHNLELSYTYRQSYAFVLNYVRGLRTLGEVFLQGPGNTMIASYGNYKSSSLLYFSVSANKALTRHWQVSLNPMVGLVSMDNAALGVSRTYSRSVFAGQLQMNQGVRFGKGWQAEFTCLYITPFRYGAYTRKPQFNSDLGLSKSVWKNRVSLKLGISDLFNTTNVNREIHYDNLHSQVRYKAESRFVNLTARYKFGNRNVKARSRMESKISDLQSRTN